jgi:hypothetical protein
MTDEQPSAEAIEAMRQAITHYLGNLTIEEAARAADAFAARRVEQERERFLKIMHAYGLEYTLPGEGAIEDVISGITTRGSGRPKP